MEKTYKLLVINPGSTSTKVAVYENEEARLSVSIQHTSDELRNFATVWDQHDYRLNAILGELEKAGEALEAFDCIACRGANFAPLTGGIYEVSPEAIDVLKSERYGVHPNSVGNLIAYNLGQRYKVPVITVDPPVTDELCESARYSGIPQITRLSSFHALNQKATARKVAARLGRAYTDVNMIVAHLGGGISVGAHERGRIIDVNNALDGDGPFSPERAGTLPVGSLIDLCFSGEYDHRQARRLVCGGGGLVAYLGTSDTRSALEKAAAGDTKARAVCDAMLFQVVKEIGAMACVLSGKVDAIALTGSIAYSEYVVQYIKEHTSFIAAIFTVPGENEMEALRDGALRYLKGEEEALTFEPGRGLPSFS